MNINGVETENHDLLNLEDFNNQIKNLGGLNTTEFLEKNESKSYSGETGKEPVAFKPKERGFWSASAEKIWSTGENVLPGFDTYSHIEMAKKEYKNNLDPNLFDKKVSSTYHFIRNAYLFQDTLDEVVKPVQKLLDSKHKFFPQTIKEHMNLFTPAKLSHIGRVGLVLSLVIIFVPSIIGLAFFTDYYLPIILLGTLAFLAGIGISTLILKGYGFRTSDEPFEKVREEILRLLNMLEARESSFFKKDRRQMIVAYKKEIEKTNLVPNMKNWGLLYNSLLDLAFLFDEHNLNNRVIIVRSNRKSEKEKTI